jgi:hypothetical protein
LLNDEESSNGFDFKSKNDISCSIANEDDCFGRVVAEESPAMLQICN